VFPKLMSYLVDSDRFTRSELIAALRFALEMHEPDHRHGGVGIGGTDKCSYCKHGEPLAVFMGDINDERTLVHCHGYHRWCAGCGADYPCPSVEAICEALGVTT
jgi:hypothetical protein